MIHLAFSGRRFPLALRAGSTLRRRWFYARGVNCPRRKPCGAMLRSRRCGVLGSFLDTKDRKHFRQNVDRSLLYLLPTEPPQPLPAHPLAVIPLAAAPPHPFTT